MKRVELTVVLAILLTVLLLGAPVTSQEHPSVVKGLSAPTTYELSDLDAINVSNGSLVLTVPLGIAYPVSGNLSYRFTLVSMLNPWFFQRQSDNSIVAELDRRSNAGFGWRLSFGEMYEPFSFFNETGHYLLLEGDGTKRLFHGHPWDDGVSALGNTLYTRDGSYLRLRRNQTCFFPVDSATPVPCSIVDAPNGNRRLFDVSGRLRRMEDAFGNWMQIEYSPTSWTITDIHERSHTVQIVTDPNQSELKKIESVTLAAFGGGQATYDLQYENRVITKPYGIAVTETYSMLRHVVLPDDASFDFDYDDRAQPTEMVLPTLGKVRWSFTEWVYYLNPNPREGDPVWLESGSGVASKSLLDSNDTVLGTWSYLPVPPAGPNDFRTVEVTDPEGNDTVYYFNEHNGDLWEALSFSAQHPGSDGTYLSREEYSGVYDPSDKSNLEREVYLTYRMGGTTQGALDPAGTPPGQPTDPQVVKQRVVEHNANFAGDADVWTQTTRSGYDGLGHFRNSLLTGNGAGVDRTTAVNYNVNSSTYDCSWSGPDNDPTCPGTIPTLPSAGGPWILERYDTMTTTEGTSSVTSRYCFNASTGFLEKRRLLAGSQDAGKDLLQVFTPTAGFVGSETYYGGDIRNNAPVPHSCSSVPATADYQINHTYENGALSTSQYSGKNFFTVDRDIDANTGLVSKARDTSGLVETALDYDNQGRVTEISPNGGNGACVKHTYTPATVNAAAKIDSVTRPNGCSDTTALAQSSIVFDDLGRVHREGQLLPGGWSYRQTDYNALGWRTRVSSLEQSPSNFTVFSDFDPYGRPGTVTGPDGSVTIFHYRGTQFRGMETNILIKEENQSPTTRNFASAEGYDRQGRLVLVTQPTLSDGTHLIHAQYAYDAADRLTQVTMHGDMTSPQQVRTFNYDGRGLLLSESHPESSTTYTQYDARGHAHRINSGLGNLDYDYDAAERLLEIKETDTSQLIKSFSYYTTNAAGKSKGKLEEARRYNLTPAGQIVVTESYEYEGRDGRVSRRNTEVSIPGAGSAYFTQSWDYNNLGLVRRTRYPCVASAASPSSCADVTQPRSVFRLYDEGLLSHISPNSTPTGSWLSFSYHENGMLASVSHDRFSPAVVYSQGVDADRMARPASFSYPGFSAALAYDGTGNVTQVGAERYYYDGASRLVEGALSTAGEQQRYEYDDFGNLTKIGRRTGSSAPFVAEFLNTSTQTNQMTLAGITYDAGGNMKTRPNASYTWDRLNQMSSLDSTAETRAFAYTADDERILTLSQPMGSTSWQRTWRLRDLDGRVLREFGGGCQTADPDALFSDDFKLGNLSCWSTVEGGDPGIPPVQWSQDWIHRDGGPAMSIQPDGSFRHYFLDHLGTTRQVRDERATIVDYQFFPYGDQHLPVKESMDAGADPFKSALRFTSHERDVNELGDAQDDLDYMHARYCSPLYGRFLSADPINSAMSGIPLSWNRYSYALNNPLKFVDPRGEAVSIAVSFAGGFSDDEKDAVLAKVQEFWEGLDVGTVYVFDASMLKHGNGPLSFFKGGRASITVDKQAQGNSHAGLVKAATIAASSELTAEQKAQAIANAVNHEVFVHQFKLGPHVSADLITYSLARRSFRHELPYSVRNRLGTVTDSFIRNDPSTRDAFTNGPVPVYRTDAEQAVRELGSIGLKPPVPRSGGRCHSYGCGWP